MSFEELENDPVLASIFRCYLTDEDKRKPDVIQALRCRQCGAVPITCVVAKDCQPGVCLWLECRQKSLILEGKKQRCPKWYFCTNCKCRISGTKQRIDYHLQSSAHHQQLSSTTVPLLLSANSNIDGQVDELQQDNAFPNDDDDISDCEGNFFALEDDNESDSFIHGDAMELEDDPTDDDDKNFPMTLITTILSKPSWMEKIFASIPVASTMDVINSLQDLREMKFYFVAEHASPNGGVRYLVTRAFKKTEFLFAGNPTGEKFASDEESKWHFYSFVQYMSMNTQQKVRQSIITRPFVPANFQFFQETWPLNYRELHRFYGRSNQHCLWNTLPVPQVSNINGIAYINPLHALRYLMAHGLEVDDFYAGDGKPNDESVSSSSGSDSTSPHSKIFYIAESAACREMKLKVLNSPEYKQALKDTGADHVCLLWCVDWRDGFGSNRTKQNRKSTVAWTISFSTPKDRVNSISNTIPIAVGLKKNHSWDQVEHQFRNDMLAFGDGTKPVMVYRGDIKKVVPMFVVRLACLTDKVERADYTSTLHYASSLHRCFGTIIKIQKPKYKCKQIEAFLLKQKDGSCDRNLKQYGWSRQFVDNSEGQNGGKFPACASCRRQNILNIINGNNDDDLHCACSECANWTLDDSTKDMLDFDAPKDYPTKVFFEVSPVQPPAGREVGLKKLKLIKLDFPYIVQAIRFAFHQSKGGRGKSWTKANCCAYLRTCGVNKKHQDQVYEAAKKAHQAGIEVDYHSPTSLGDYRFAAAYCGELSMSRFIETIMHLLFLGIAEDLFRMFIALYSKSCDIGKETFKKQIQALLQALTKFNLSWLLIIPFSGSSDGKLTTGSWVSENWLAFVRILKVISFWFGKDGIDDERDGVNDLYRVIMSFLALVARVLSHAGVDESTIIEIGLYIKEFLSAVDEIDIRLRYKELNAVSGGFGKDKDLDPFWLKSNFMSLLNLVETIRLLGPLINLWDGGGKGERYIQEIKPHIPRGVRDGGLFFVRLIQKIYKLHCIRMIEDLWDIMDDDMQHFDDGASSISSSDNFESENGDGASELSTVHGSSNGGENSASGGDTHDADSDSDDSSSEIEGDSNDTDVDSDAEDASDVEGPAAFPEQTWSSNVEQEQLRKARTIYVYKTVTEMEHAFNTNSCLAGIIVKGDDEKPEFMMIHKMKGGQCGWVNVVFNDKEGVKHCGLWYSPVVMEVANGPKSIASAKRRAEMSAVAIPLHYIVGDNHVDSRKYCVVTNWWQERNSQGGYSVPSLETELYDNAFCFTGTKRSKISAGGRASG